MFFYSFKHPFHAKDCIKAKLCANISPQKWKYLDENNFKQLNAQTRVNGDGKKLHQQKEKKTFFFIKISILSTFSSVYFFYTFTKCKWDIVRYLLGHFVRYLNIFIHLIMHIQPFFYGNKYIIVGMLMLLLWHSFFFTLCLSFSLWPLRCHANFSFHFLLLLSSKCRDKKKADQTFSLFIKHIVRRNRWISWVE